MSRESQLKLKLVGQTLRLLPERAFYWEEQKLLGLSDLHIGKAQSLQKHGIPMPAASHHEDLEKLRSLVEQLSPEQVVILGDFIHAKNSWDAELHQTLRDFFKSLPQARWSLIIGNHERGSQEPLSLLGIEIVKEELRYENLVLAHGHDTKKEYDGSLGRIEGHVHPVCVLREGPTRLRLPCFVLENEILTLPAFGVLTGGHEIRPQLKNRIFAIAGKDIFEINERSAHGLKNSLER